MSDSVLGVVGSPRLEGATHQIVDAVLSGAVQSGARSRTISLGSLTISGCQGCNGCVSTGRCLIQDGMAGVLEAMDSHDVWVLGTPIYWVGPTSQFKTFVDRWKAPWTHPDTQHLFEGRRAVLVTSMESAHSNTTDPTVEMLSRTLTYLGVPLVAHIAGSGYSPSGRTEVSEGILQEAKQAGGMLFH